MYKSSSTLCQNIPCEMLYTENFLAKSTLGIRYQAFLLKYAGTSVSNTAAIYLKEKLECTYIPYLVKKNHYFCRFLLFTY